ncbi:hypothetical protein [Rhodococcus jostii]|uniref:Uncharacterized protein n=1 Tax=Rhodococcus jostii TaxID=132919 RepID=A0A1H4RXI2_RHOJO|nr:hypothetical protein [Rhodococcus jostii]SEC36633.1 hypothetical protein SAMN04490220_1452 [Rhodococcus jostii]
MRILRAFVGAVASAIILVLALLLYAPLPTAQAECMRMPYFTPFGYANFDFPPRVVAMLNDNEIAVEGITPFEAKPAKTGLYLPIGSHTNHIDACMGVFYPGGPRFVSKTGNSVVAEDIWLRMDGAYGTVTINGVAQGERMVATYNVGEMMPTLMTPHGGGIGPTYWPFRFSPYFAQTLNDAAGAQLFTAGELFANLDAVGKFAP